MFFIKKNKEFSEVPENDLKINKEYYDLFQNELNELFNYNKKYNNVDSNNISSNNIDSNNIDSNNIDSNNNINNINNITKIDKKKNINLDKNDIINIKMFIQHIKNSR